MSSRIEKHVYTFVIGCCCDSCLHQAASKLHLCVTVSLFYLTYLHLMFSVKLLVYTLLYMEIKETPFTKRYDRSARFTTYMK